MRWKWVCSLVVLWTLCGAEVAQAQGLGPAPAPSRVGADDLKMGWREMTALFKGFAGIPMWALVGCGVLVLTFAVDRLVVTQARRVAPPVFTRRFLQHLREEDLNPELARELLDVCRDHPSIIARFYAIVIENYGRTQFEIRTAVSDLAETELFQLRKHIRAIGNLATVAPLLGLFGTVIGMIEAFQALSGKTGAGKTELLASGISLALVATASGLAVAIVASVVYYFMQGRVDKRIHELELLTNQAVALVASDGPVIKEAPKKTKASLEATKSK
jgi:biopolymer transport protein ExbB